MKGFVYLFFACKTRCISKFYISTAFECPFDVNHPIYNPANANRGGEGRLCQKCSRNTTTSWTTKQFASLADATSKIFLTTRSVVPDAERLASDGWTGAFNHAMDTLKQHPQSNSDGSRIAVDVIYLRGPHGFESIAKWCEDWARSGAELWRMNIALDSLIAGAQPFMYVFCCLRDQI